MRLLLTDAEIDINNENYVFCNLSSHDLCVSFEAINELIISDDITEITFLMPFNNMDFSYDLAQALYNNQIYNVNKAFFSDGQIIDIESMWTDKPRLNYFEYEITNRCNLRCKGCAHFSYLDESDDPSINDYIKDIDCLSQKYSDIKEIKLLGGEPLLSRNLKNYLLITRHYFPDTNLIINTNGLLLDNVPDDLVKTMHDLNIRVFISLYPQFRHLKDEMIHWAERNEINYVFDETFIFLKFLSNKNDVSNHMNHEVCHLRNCHMLKNGKLSKCPFPVSIHRLNNKFGTMFPTGDYVDIYTTSAWEINKFLSLEAELCYYCLQHPERFTCKQVKSIEKISVNDWVKSPKQSNTIHHDKIFNSI